MDEHFKHSNSYHHKSPAVAYFTQASFSVNIGNYHHRAHRHCYSVGTTTAAIDSVGKSSAQMSAVFARTNWREGNPELGLAGTGHGGRSLQLRV